MITSTNKLFYQLEFEYLKSWFFLLKNPSQALSIPCTHNNSDIKIMAK